jgi:hypothetical protein
LLTYNSNHQLRKRKTRRSYPVEEEFANGHLFALSLYVDDVVFGADSVALIVEGHFAGLSVHQDLLLDEVEEVATGFPDLSRIVTVFGSFGYLFGLVQIAQSRR